MSEADDVEPTQADLEVGVRLLEASDRDTLSFLGLQAERLEMAQQRAAAGRSVPPWSTSDAVQTVLTEQRASPEDLLRYAGKGLDFARDLLGKIETELRRTLCAGSAVRPEVSSLESNGKELVKYVASSIVGYLLINLPGAIALAVTSIATTLAVLVIKNGMTRFCTVGAQSLQTPA
jgi:hypothetical protein